MDLEKESSACGSILRQKISKMLSKIPYIHSEKKCFIWKKMPFSISCWTLSEKILAFHRKIFGKVAKNCILGAHKVILKKLFFRPLSFFRSFMRLLSKEFGKVDNTALYASKEVFWGRKSFVNGKIFSWTRFATI